LNFLNTVYSEFIENRTAVAKLANLLNSNSALVTYKKNIYNDLTNFDSFYLNMLSEDLEPIYEKGKKFFLRFEESVSEWEKFSKKNQYSLVVFEVMRNASYDLYTALFKAEVALMVVKQFVPSIPSDKSDSTSYNENKEIDLFQWINYLEINLCDISIMIKECKYELTRVKNILTYISEINLHDSSFRIHQYQHYLDTIMKELKKDNMVIKSSVRFSNKLKSLISIIKFNYEIFLRSQDIFSKFSDNSLNAAKNVEIKFFKSEFIGENGCRAEFMTYFTSPPATQGSRKTKSSPSLKYITVGANMYVDSITFEWSDNTSIKYGGNGGHLMSFELKEGEVVTWASIYKYTGGKISGLEFRTNKWRSTGILGNGKSTYVPTVLEAPRGYEMIGLYGSLDKQICGIGILYSKIEI
jgi:hypothetical protein